MSKKRTFRIVVKNYGDNEVNRMAVICACYQEMTAPEMQRVHAFITDRYREMLEQETTS